MKWQKCPSVTTGGKSYFWTAIQDLGLFGGLVRWWIMWDRSTKQYLLYNNRNGEKAWFDRPRDAMAVFE